MDESEPGRSVAMFVADRTLAGMTEDLLTEMRRLLDEAARRVSSAGGRVRYLGCIYMPEDDRCICLFEAADLALVQQVNDIAQVPFRRIGPAMDFRGPADAAPDEDQDAGRRAGERKS